MGLRDAPRRVPSLTVIVPTYNREHMLRQTLESLRRQTHPIDQLIVVDDCSSDGTWDLISADNRVEALRTPGQSGKPVAVNLALARVTSDIVWIFDDDDIAFEDAVARIVATFAEHPDAAFVFGTMSEADSLPDGQLGPVRDGKPLPDLADGIFVKLLEICFLGGATLAVRTDRLREIGGFDESLIRSQDYDVALRSVRGQHGVQVPGGPLYILRQHAGTRGSAAVSFSARNKSAKWLEYDQILLRKLRNSLELHEYCGQRWANGCSRRLALLHRAFIMGTKCLDDEVVEDLRMATAEQPEKPLDRHEVEVLARLFFYQPYYTGKALVERPAVYAATLDVLQPHPAWRRALFQVTARRTGQWAKSVVTGRRIGLQRANFRLLSALLR
jgi:glycosyltransferase involved in cell wall biosynthesis